MADLSQVEEAIVNAAAGLLFPGDAYQDDAYAVSAAGISCSLYRGFPTAAVLDRDLAAGKAHVTVFPQPMLTRLLIPYQDYWRSMPGTGPTLQVGTSGNLVTFGGTASVGHVAGVKYRSAAAVYLVQAGDTPVTVAQALAAQMAAVGLAVSTSGATMTFPDDANLLGRVMLPSPAMLQTRWQEQSFQLTVWSPTPQARDALCSLIDGGLAAVYWLPLADGSAGQITYHRTVTTDMPGRDDLWRRDLFYCVKYPTTLIQSQPQMMFGIGNLTDQGAVTVA